MCVKLLANSLKSYCGDGSKRGRSRAGRTEAGSEMAKGNKTQNTVGRLSSGRELSALVFIKDLRF